MKGIPVVSGINGKVGILENLLESSLSKSRKDLSACLFLV